MAVKSLGIKEETVILLNRARSILQAKNPKKRYYDDDVVFTALTELIARRGKHAKKNRGRTKSGKPLIT